MGKTQPMPKLDAPSKKGAPLSDSLKHSLETIHQCDLSKVRVHEGQEAVHLGAKAFVQGTDIYFAPGETPPPLAAHEAWHVVQQATGGLNNSTPPVAKGLIDAPHSNNSEGSDS